MTENEPHTHARPRTHTTPKGAALRPWGCGFASVYLPESKPPAHSQSGAETPARGSRLSQEGRRHPAPRRPAPATAAAAFPLTDAEKPTPRGSDPRASDGGFVNGGTGRPGWEGRGSPSPGPPTRGPHRRMAKTLPSNTGREAEGAPPHCGDDVPL